MNKLTKVLSIFLIAGLIGTGTAVGLTGCGNKTPEEPPKQTEDENKNPSGGEQGGQQGGSQQGGEQGGSQQGGEQGGSQQGGEETGDKITVPNDAINIKAGGLTQSYTLSSTQKTITLDKSAIKVNFIDDANAKVGEDIDAKYYTVTLKKGNDVLDSWEGLGEGTYVIAIKLINAKDSSGTAVTDMSDSIQVVINNPVVSIALKTGTVTQVQSTTDSMTSTWTFEGTKADDSKVDVTSQVSIGNVDTTQTGTRSVTVTLGTVTTTVNYTINEDTSKVAQSYALNFTHLITNDVKVTKDNHATAGYTSPDGHFYVASTKPEVADHGQSFDGKFFAKRLKFGGKSNGGKSSSDFIYIKITTEGSAKLTVYNYTNGGTEGQLTGRNVALTTGYTGPGKDSTTIGTVVDEQSYDTVGKVNEKHTFNIPAAGTYYLVAVDGDICFTYLQLDQLVDNSQGDKEAVALAEGTNEALKLNLNTDSVKTVYKSGDTFSAEGLTATVNIANSVTCAGSTQSLVLTDLNVTGPTDMTTLGDDKEVNVSYTPAGSQTAITAKYIITVETAVDGVTNVKVSDTLTNKQVDSDSDTLEVKLSDLATTIDGKNGHHATAVISSATYVKKDTSDTPAALTAEGVRLAPGTYTISATVAVTSQTDGEYTGQTDTLTVTCEITVTVKPAEGAITESVIGFLHTGKTPDGGSAVYKENLALPATDLTGTAVTAVTLKSNGSDGYAVRNDKGSQTIGGTTYNIAIDTKGGSGAVGDNDIAKRWIELTLAQAGNYNITVYLKGGSSRQLIMHSGASGAKVIASPTDVTGSGVITATFSGIACGTTVKIAGTNGLSILAIVVTPVTE